MLPPRGLEAPGRRHANGVILQAEVWLPENGLQAAWILELAAPALGAGAD
jgi:hypothetical protein